MWRTVSKVFLISQPFKALQARIIKETIGLQSDYRKMSFLHLKTTILCKRPAPHQWLPLTLTSYSDCPFCFPLFSLLFFGLSWIILIITKIHEIKKKINLLLLRTHHSAAEGSEFRNYHLFCIMQLATVNILSFF